MSRTDEYGTWECAGRRWLGIMAMMVLWLFAADSAQAIKQEELLPPDKAFVFSAEPIAADMVRVQWRIADGYYLYRDKIRFDAANPAISFGPPVMPSPTDTKTDEFFGKMAIYRGIVTIDIPVIRSREAGGEAVKLRAHSQGCADVGVCFPPHTQTASLQLAAVAAPLATGHNSGGLRDVISSITDKLGLGSKKQAFLDPEQAFVLLVDADANRLLARWQIAKDYYLYRDKFAFSLRDADGVTLGSYTMPPGVPKVDESFGRSEVYYNEVAIALPLTRHDSNAPRAVTLETRYQGCADAGLCYPPTTKTVAVTLPAAGASAINGSAGLADGGSDDFVSEQDRYAQSLVSDNRFLTLLSFFGVGILLAFTPCMFPMVPILSSLIVGQGTNVTTRRAFSLSLAYVLAMAVTYTVAGIIAGLFGANLQATFQNPWIIGSFSAVFVLLALSMFGFYNLQVPASWQTRISEFSNRQRGGTYVGAAVMGLLSALIVGPCMAAPLAGALIYIGQSGDAALGGSALFAMSIGMGIPLLAVGASAGRWLPRVSGWMNTIKAVFGVLLLALAIWMLDRIIPPQVTMLLWGVLLIVTAVYMGALTGLLPEADGWQKLRKGTGLVMLVYGGLLLVGAAGGGHDVLQPLRGVSFTGSGTQAATSQAGMRFIRVKGVSGLEKELQAAQAAGKTAMLDFYADWCVSCKEMERNTFSHPEVRAALADTVLLQADVTANDAEDQALLKRFGLFGPPSILFFGKNGDEHRRYRLVGFLGPDDFSAHVKLAFGS